MEDGIADQDLVHERGAAGVPRLTRRLSDKILIAFITLVINPTLKLRMIYW